MIAARFVKQLNLIEGMTVRVTAPKVEVHNQANQFAQVICNILNGVILLVLEVYRTADKKLLWIRVAAGWIIATDGTEEELIQVVHEDGVLETALKDEKSKRERMSSAVAAMLIKSYSLPRAKRLARSILRHAKEHYPQTPLLKISKESIEDVMIILGGKIALTKAQVFEYIKAAAARQSNPLQSVIDISQEIYDIIFSRPSVWVVEDMNVITTEDVRIRNNNFIMSAAEGDLEKFKRYLAQGQELTSLHSQFLFTALHAAANFGQAAIVECIIQSGLSLNIRDPKHGQTALHFAADSGRVDCAKLLLEAGADRTLPNYKGVLPYQVADEQGNIECREALKFLPPPVQHIDFTDVGRHSVSLIWQSPPINRSHTPIIVEYCVEFQIVEMMDDLHDPPLLYTSLTHCSFNHLTPSRVHRARIKCRAASGWSGFSTWFYVKTIAFHPEPPLPVETVKVSINALLLHWFPPIRDNGFPVDFYELEIADHVGIDDGSLGIHGQNTNGHADETDGDDEDDTGGFLSNSGVSIRTRRNRQNQQKPQFSAGGSTKLSAISKLHRVMKHKNVEKRLKYVTGLEPHRLYRSRVRAHNEIGMSPWSEWSAPVAPRLGAIVEEFVLSESAAKVEWFEPKLCSHRHVVAYELQLCRLKGPTTVELNIDSHVQPDKLTLQRQPLVAPQSYEEYITISNSLVTNRFTMSGLRAGGRYQLRVRSKLSGDDDWLTWDDCVKSEAFVMPATPPDPPVALLPRVIEVKVKRIGEEINATVEDEASKKDDDVASVGSDSHHQAISPIPHSQQQPETNSVGTTHIDLDSEQSIACSTTSSYHVPDDRVTLSDDLEITHDSITLVWNNGDSNGEEVVEYDVEMARIRSYNPKDVIFARDAYMGGGSGGNGDNGRGSAEDDEDDNFNFKSQNIYLSASDVLSSTGRGIKERLNWERITAIGHFLGPQCFRIGGLHPGHCYAFRIRQRNACGWSKFSKASPLIVTHPSVPPNAPMVLAIRNTHVVLCWEEVELKDASLTTLEYQVQIRRLYTNPKKPDELISTSNGITNSRNHQQETDDVRNQISNTNPPPSIDLGDESLFQDNWQVGDSQSLGLAELSDYMKFSSYSKFFLSKGPASAGKFAGCLLRNLVESQWYVARVRVRTVIGWSPWSIPAECFRTLR